MKRSSGTHAITAAYGAGFQLPGLSLPGGEEYSQPGRRLVRMKHPDGRQLLIAVKLDDPQFGDPQYGDLIEIYAASETPDAWKVPFDERSRVVNTLDELLALLAEHDPDREFPYSGEDPLPQVRELDGRERDILTRVLSDLRSAWIDPACRSILQRVVRIDGDAEVLRMIEMIAVLDPRDD